MTVCGPGSRDQNAFMRGFIILTFASFLFACKTDLPETDIRPGQVKGAQSLFGLAFTENEIDTLLTTLEDCLDGYRAMRRQPLPHSAVPAFHFDPRPEGFSAPTGKSVFAPSGLPEVSMPADTQEIAFYSIPQLASLLRSGQLTSRRLTKIYLERIEQYDDTLQAVITLTTEYAFSCADQADRDFRNGTDRSILQGIPYGMKDLASFPGYPTTWGAAPYKDQFISDTAEVIRRLESAGAVMIAKLSSGELANGDTWFGGKTKNPWDLKQGASGSSAGSGAATAAGLVGFAIGTETWGSILSPSSRCGISGLRPTFGRVSRFGVMPLAWTLDKIGPMCRTPEGCAYVFKEICGLDEKDRSTTGYPYSYVAEIDPGSIRAGYLDSIISTDTTATGRNARRAISKFKTLGIQFEGASLPDQLPWSRLMYYMIRSEASSVFDDLIMRNEDDLLARKSRYSRANSLRAGELIPAVAYVQANRYRAVLMQQMDSLFHQYDVFFVLMGEENESAISNLTGHPAISVPTGFDEQGRPTSLVIIGKLYQEGVLLALANQFRQVEKYQGNVPLGFQ